MAAFITKRN